MKILLIFTSNELNPNYDELIFRDEAIGYIPPLSLMSVAAILEKKGVEVQLMDLDAECLNYAAALERIARFSPDMLGFTLTTFSFQPVFKWIRKFKTDTQLPILVGGPHCALYPDEIMIHPEIDFMIVGEAEIPLGQFVDAFQRGRGFDSVRSLGFRRRDGSVSIEKTRQWVEDINDPDWVPYPARHLIRNELYANILTRRKNFTAMLSTRGCPYRCTFCDQKTPVYRTRTPESLVREFKYNLEHFNIREFDMYDSTFTANPRRLIEICDLMVREGLDLGWTIRSRVDSVTEEMIKALKAAGCHTIMYGIESADPGILKRMKKDITVERIRRTIGFTKEQGIDTLGFFMFGYPGETRLSIEETLRLSRELPLDYAQYTVLVPITDTEIYDYYLQRGLRDYWREYTLHPDMEVQKIELLETELTRDETSRYVSLGYRQFYFRPRIIWNRFWRMRSFDAFKRLTIGAYGILKNSLFGSGKTAAKKSEDPAAVARTG